MSPFGIAIPLDFQVSGVLILPLSSSAAAELGAALEAHRVEKYYLARVDGRFPSDVVKTVQELSTTIVIRDVCFLPKVLCLRLHSATVMTTGTYSSDLRAWHYDL